jgi:peptidoglycan hydrolase CwlO-like protein
MEQQIANLQTEVAELRKQVELLTAAVEKLTGTTQRMDDHIDFVEQTYTSLRSPLDYIRQRFWSGTQELPEPPNQNLLALTSSQN